MCGTSLQPGEPSGTLPTPWDSRDGSARSVGETARGPVGISDRTSADDPSSSGRRWHEGSRPSPAATSPASTPRLTCLGRLAPAVDKSAETSRSTGDGTRDKWPAAILVDAVAPLGGMHEKSHIAEQQARMLRRCRDGPRAGRSRALDDRHRPPHAHPEQAPPRPRSHLIPAPEHRNPHPTPGRSTPTTRTHRHLRNLTDTTPDNPPARTRRPQRHCPHL